MYIHLYVRAYIPFLFRYTPPPRAAFSRTKSEKRSVGKMLEIFFRSGSDRDGWWHVSTCSPSILLPSLRSRRDERRKERGRRGGGGGGSSNGPTLFEPLSFGDPATRKTTKSRAGPSGAITSRAVARLHVRVRSEGREDISTGQATYALDTLFFLVAGISSFHRTRTRARARVKRAERKWRKESGRRWKEWVGRAGRWLRRRVDVRDTRSGEGKKRKKRNEGAHLRPPDSHFHVYATWKKG